MEHLFSRTVYRQAPDRRPDYSMTKEISMMAALEANKEKSAREAQRSSRATSSWSRSWIESMSTEDMFSAVMKLANDSSIYSRNLRRTTERHSV
mmetsp:Transcript_20908/g.35649  ORF Transcript_20908/g.35649 Transcript_20908/m.35649 type:complete len:94 (+) Transcript_20908:620-901(+)